ncbi:CBS domain-containing protein [Streptomyces spirodelae]|uniref:CBS domain-containing protein n=1 Tax=Streptomyces spirodelae TaxID=2812904 RepID=A0ABS3WXC8_9ACTN|nr:CBS domain-containing protein [Streptomyces spirodelae]MBO8187790.1 CBS domain-containing protein [Streptomyces spirodelae]
MSHRRVRDLMSRPAVCAHPGTGLKDAARLLAEHDISALPVTDQDDRPLGVVSEGDLLRAQAELPEPADLLLTVRRGRGKGTGTGERSGTLDGLMTSPAVVASPEWTVVEAARTMQEHGVKRLPVVSGTGRVIGVLSRADLLRVFLRKDSAIEDEVVDEVLGRTLGLSRAQVTAYVTGGVVKVHGEIGSEDSLPLIERLCRDIDGVVDVQLDLSVAGVPGRAA